MIFEATYTTSRGIEKLRISAESENEAYQKALYLRNSDPINMVQVSGDDILECHNNSNSSDGMRLRALELAVEILKGWSYPTAEDMVGLAEKFYKFLSFEK